MYFFKSCSKSYLFNKWLDICACYLIKSYIFIEKWNVCYFFLIFHSHMTLHQTLIFTWAASKMEEILILGKQTASEELVFQVYSVMRSQKWILNVTHAAKLHNCKNLMERLHEAHFNGLMNYTIILEIGYCTKYFPYLSNMWAVFFILWYPDIKPQNLLQRNLPIWNSWYSFIFSYFKESIFIF